MKQFVIAGTSLVATFVLLGGVVTAANVDPTEASADNADPLIYQETVDIDLSADSDNIAWFKYYATTKSNSYSSANYKITLSDTTNAKLSVYSSSDMKTHVDGSDSEYTLSKNTWYYIAVSKTNDADVSCTLSVTAGSGDGQYTNISSSKSIYTYDKVVKVDGLKNVNGDYYYYKDGSRMTGIQTIGEDKYYFDYYGKAYKNGVQKVGKYYYDFDANGVIQTGLITIDSDTYYFAGENGEAKIGWDTIEGDKYYFGSNGKAYKNSVKKIGDCYYGFDEKGVMQTGLATIDSEIYFFNDEGVMQTGWQKVGENKYYFNSSVYGRAVRNTVRMIDGGNYYGFDENGVMQTGLATINSATYFFNDEGVRQGNCWQEVDGNKYYFGSDGKAVTGFQSYINGKAYGFDSNGVMLTGLSNIGDSTYYFGGEDGEALTGLQKITVGEGDDAVEDYYYFCILSDVKYGLKYELIKAEYSFTSDGKYYSIGSDGKALKGWQNISDSWYYFDPEEAYAWKDGLKTIGTGDDAEIAYFDGKIAQSGLMTLTEGTFYFAPDAEDHPVAAKGLQTITGPDSNSYLYFFGEDGKAVTGLQKVTEGEGNQAVTNVYYFNETGADKNRAVKDTDKEIGGKKYKFGSDYKAVKGWSGFNYYDPAEGCAVDGLVTIGTGDDAALYYFVDYEVQSGFKEIPDGDVVKTYYFDPTTHKAATGLLEIGGDTYFFNEDSAIRIESDFVITEDGDFYYFGEDGKAYKDCIKNIGTDIFCFDEDGIMARNKMITDDGEQFYFGEDCAMVKGWLKLDGSWYFMDKDTGAMVTDTMITDDGAKYLLQADGKMFKGWKQQGDDWYYFESSGAMATGWSKAGNYWYFFDENGVMLTGWQELEGVWYYLKSSGAMATAWEQVNGRWYYFDQNGHMQTGMIELDSGKYYLSDSGAMVTGWRLVEGSWYYFNDNGSMAKGWKLINNVWYFMDESTGVMVTGSKTINGKAYEFASSGACTNPNI